MSRALTCWAAAGRTAPTPARAEQIIPDPAVAVGSRLTLVVSNAGDTKGGTVYAYIG